MSHETDQTRERRKIMEAGSRDFRNLGLKIFLPVAIGLGVVAWLFHREFDPAVWHSIRWDAWSLFGVALAWLAMAGRDFGMTWRFKALTSRQLSWGQALRVCMLCEFTSCITPSSVGGSAVSMLFLNREGVELGRATTLVMTTLLLDELFFVLALPVIICFVPYAEIFGFDKSAFSTGLQGAFWGIYGLIVIWTAALFFGVLAKPAVLNSMLTRLFSFRWLRRWRESAMETGRNMEATGRELRNRGAGWWIENFGATVFSWVSRFLVVNALFLAFVPAASQVVVLARQFVVWVILMVTPTPGGAGVSEWLFTTYYGDLIGSAGIALVIALMWRIVTYYVYLVIGAFIVPQWVRRSFGKGHKGA